MSKHNPFLYIQKQTQISLCPTQIPGPRDMKLEEYNPFIPFITVGPTKSKVAGFSRVVKQ